VAGAIEAVSALGSALSGAAVITTFIAYRWRRARQLAEQRKKLARPPLELREGYCRLNGIAKKRRRSEHDVLASGCNVSVIVVSGRERYWKRAETRQEARSFNLLTDNGEKVRVCLRDSGWTLETAARERNGPERRSVEYDLTDGERVWVEGELQAVVRKRKAGYRDNGSLKRWEFKADGAEIRMWTEGALAAHEATVFLPPVFSILLWSFVAFMLGWSLSIAMGGRLSSGEFSVFVALSAAMVGLAIAVVVVQSMGGWIGSRPWFQRKE
jgi:hypothetical protein